MGGGTHDGYQISAKVTDYPGSNGMLHNGAAGYKPPKYYKSTLVFHATSLNVESCEIGNSESDLDRE